MGNSTAIADSIIILVDKKAMVRLLHKQPGPVGSIHRALLARNIRVQEDLVDQLFNSSEKRLARTLLLLARYGKHDRPVRAVPPVSQATLAEIVGTTRSWINFFMRKFQRLGFIDYKNGLVKVNNTLLTIVLRDGHAAEPGPTRAHARCAETSGTYEKILRRLGGLKQRSFTAP